MSRSGKEQDMKFVAGVVTGVLGTVVYAVGQTIRNFFAESVRTYGVDGTMEKVRAIGGDRKAVRRWLYEMEVSRTQRRLDEVSPSMSENLSTVRDVLRQASEEARRVATERVESGGSQEPDPVGDAFPVARQSVADYLNSRTPGRVQRSHESGPSPFTRHPNGDS